MPQLAEQFFWARSYEYRTGVPFLRASASVANVAAAVSAAQLPRVHCHLSIVSAQMRRSRPAIALRTIAANILAA